MGIEINSGKAFCSRCGKEYAKHRGIFAANHAELYKGLGRLNVCMTCVDNMYSKYLSQCNDVKLSVRQVCRKLDLYWSEKVFSQVERVSTCYSVMAQYLKKINSPTYGGKSYDDTLLEEGTLWSFTNPCSDTDDSSESTTDAYENLAKEEIIPVSDEIVSFWGPGLDDSQYRDLEQRRSYWMSRLPDNIEFDIGTEAIIRQLCSLELDINRDRAAGRAVDKSINALNSLLGSAKLKPTQKNTDTDSTFESTPFGVWIRKWEERRPVPEPDPELKDVDGIIKYILTWFYGHIGRMLGVKNMHSKLYEDAIEQYRVSAPEYDEEDDDTLLYDIFSSEEDNDNVESSSVETKSNNKSIAT